MFTSFSMDSTSNCIFDHLYRNAPYRTTGIDYSYPPVDFTPIWKWMVTELPSKVKKEQYPDYPKCNHAITKEGTNIFEIGCASFKEEEIDIEVKDDYIIISGNQEHAEADEENDSVYVHRGLAQRDFEFAIKVSDKFDTDKIDAKLLNGLLTITIPLKEEITKKNRKIALK